jgi:Arc/MetJ-type ribon-helix-helix transcriptional regulator
MTIHLPPNIESSIQAVVHRGRYASVDDAMTEAASLLLQRLEQEQSQATTPVVTPTFKPIWEEFADIAASIPDEEWAKLPVDGAEQHDHYVYGIPKRPPSK